MHDIRFHRPRPARAAATKSTRRVIAVCGKGGVGKTAFSALLTSELARRPEAGSVLAVDADPALGLALALDMGDVPTVGEVRESLIRAAQVGDEEQEQLIAEHLDGLIMDAVVEGDGFALLAMGRSDALGCYCSVNDILRDAIELLASRFDTVVIDGEAGLEQINRQVLGQVDHLLLLSDGSARSLATVNVLQDIAQRDGIAPAEGIGIVYNRSTFSVDELVEQSHNLGAPIVAHLPFDEALIAADAACMPLSSLGLENPAAHAVAHLVDDLLG